MSTAATTSAPSSSTSTLFRFEVRPSQQAGDPAGEAVMRDAQAALGINISGAHTAKCYIIEGLTDDASAQRVLTALLANPVLEVGLIGASDAPVELGPASHTSIQTIEVWPLPGVMDPAALTVTTAVAELLGVPADTITVTTGRRYDLAGIDETQANSLATRLLSNPVIEKASHEPWQPASLPHGAPTDQTLRTVTLTTLDDAGLQRLSKDGHLFLNLTEMQGVRDYYNDLGREPTDIELETIAQTWSEHCVHKTLKSSVRYTQDADAPGTALDWANRPGTTVNADGSVSIDNLLKSTVAAATFELIDEGLDWTLSVFVDNSGIIKFTDDQAVCIKVETHNRPSAIEPYGGAATGIGGCIRDIMGTGLAAKPIANTDVFCVAYPEQWAAEQPEESSGQSQVPPGVLHPRRVLTRVVDGVRDYGNRMGIPTVNGSVHFDNRYIGNPLVFAGCVGLIPSDLATGDPNPGDLIVALGGRTGKDGIHGATFSSGELTHTHADEFSHAVQIGNAIEEKRVLDAILVARDAEDKPLYSAITDCGAGGFSSAVGEMGEKIGANVNLDDAPLKYAGLRYDEVWISESQERMVLAVPEANLAKLQAVCDQEHVELAVLGTFGHFNDANEPELILNWDGAEVGRVTMPFLHDGVPMPTKDAHWAGTKAASVVQPPLPLGEGWGEGAGSSTIDFVKVLCELLAEPNTASKRWIVRQYDHEVQGNTVVKPLAGPSGEAPMDASVIQPVPTSSKGLAIGGGLANWLGHQDNPEADPYEMAVAGIDECVRNLVCVGADPEQIAILDNFCWPNCDEPRNMAALVRACAGCYDAAKKYKTPFVSGKDSLNNQFRYTDRDGNQQLIEIPYTLLISGIGIVPDIANVVTSDLKVSNKPTVVAICAHDDGSVAAREAHKHITSGNVLAAHDASEGGPLVALAEMAIGAVEVDGAATLGLALTDLGASTAFQTGTYLLHVSAEYAAANNLPIAATVTTDGLLTSSTGEEAPVATLRDAWLGTLDW